MVAAISQILPFTDADDYVYWVLYFFWKEILMAVSCTLNISLTFISFFCYASFCSVNMHHKVDVQFILEKPIIAHNFFYFSSKSRKWNTWVGNIIDLLPEWSLFKSQSSCFFQSHHFPISFSWTLPMHFGPAKQFHLVLIF